MSIKTGRFDCIATVQVNHEKCTTCALCVKVCKGAPLYIHEGKVLVDQTRIFGCIACGQCMAVCPHEAITVEGRDLSPKDVIPIPEVGFRANYEQLYALMLARRSVRDFIDKPVESAVIDKLLAAISTAPMGIPPSDVEVLVLNGRNKVSEFSADMTNLVRNIKWTVSPLMLKLYRLLMSKASYDSYKSFIQPALEIFTEKQDEGEDWLLYNAPLAMYFHTSPYSDPVDPYIAATYAMLTAESLGLGCCMIGTIGILLKYTGKRIKQKYGIPLKNQQGIMVIFGYPAVKYRHSIIRRLAKISYR